jgi:hypothetical protein
VKRSATRVVDSISQGGEDTERRVGNDTCCARMSATQSRIRWNFPVVENNDIHQTRVGPDSPPEAEAIKKLR